MTGQNNGETVGIRQPRVDNLSIDPWPDPVERLSPDDLAFWQHFLRHAEIASAARDLAAQYLAQKYMLGPTRRLREDGVAQTG